MIDLEQATQVKSLSSQRLAYSWAEIVEADYFCSAHIAI